VDSDDTFRLMLAIAIAAFLPIAAYHRFRSLTRERLDRWQEGAFILFGLRLGGLPLFVGGLAWMINPQWMAWSSMSIPTWSRWLGIALAGGSGVLLTWAFQHLGRNLTDTVVTRNDHTLVTSGPYLYVRHPFYLSFALGYLGGGVAMANWFIVLAGVIPLGFLVARTRIEEEKLVDRFGVEYQDYRKRVGRFVPRFKQ